MLLASATINNLVTLSTRYCPTAILLLIQFSRRKERLHFDPWVIMGI